METHGVLMMLHKCVNLFEKTRNMHTKTVKEEKSVGQLLNPGHYTL
jgi:hypothetical protein